MTGFPILAMVIIFLLGLIPLVGMIGFCLIFIYRRKGQRRQSVNLVFLKIRLPEEAEYPLDLAAQFLNSFSALKKDRLLPTPKIGEHIAFEIVAKPHEISFYLAVPKTKLKFMENQVLGHYPDAEIEYCEPWSLFDNGGEVAYISQRLTSSHFMPIKSYKDMADDPLNMLTSALLTNDESSGCAIQFLIRPASSSFRKDGEAEIARLNKPPEEGEEKQTVDSHRVQAIENKINQVGFEVSVRILTISPDKEAAKAKLKTIVSAFDQLNAINLNGFTSYLFCSQKWFQHSFIYRLFPIMGINRFRGTSTLTPEELVSFVHFPTKDTNTPHIERVHSKATAPPQILPESGLYLGKSIYRATETRIFMTDDDRRRHMYIIGQTGTGKSEFLKFLALQDIYNGKGVAVIDPHGSDIDDLLPRIPPERLEDVILFDAGNVERPLGINILEANSEEQKHILVNSFINLLYKLYDPNHQGMIGPILERTIRNSMLTAMEEPGNSLVDVYRLIVDPEYVKEKIPNIKDPLVKSYWVEEVANTSEKTKSENLGYFTSKFDHFITDHIMRGIIGQSKSAFNFREIMDSGKILLVDLSKGKIGEENSNFLGMILIPRILAAAMSRSDMEEKDRKDFYLYVDEFQNFATPDFVQIMSEARKYRLNLIVANQFIGQLTDEIKDAVFGNVGTIASFRVGVDDAEYLSHQYNDKFSSTDLINSSVGKAFLKLLVKGKPSEPFSLTTDYEAMVSTPAYPDQVELIRKHSSLKYGRDRDEVDQYVYKNVQFNKDTEMEKSPSIPTSAVAKGSRGKVNWDQKA